MDIGKLVKWIVILGIVFFAWKVLLPWFKNQQLGGKPASISTASGDDSCAGLAERASESWGSGIAQFANPPYDLMAWSNYRSAVESKISAAEARCTCANESCAKVREAMRDLRSLIADMDSAMRNGSSPGNIVQRQEAIDDRINEARDLQTAGK
jgi:hypothetical protein